MGSDFVLLFRRAENEISALFPGKRAETGRKINLRPFSPEKGRIFHFPPGRWAEGGFYRRPSVRRLPAMHYGEVARLGTSTSLLGCNSHVVADSEPSADLLQFVATQ